MEILAPQLGLFFWSLVVFLVFFFIMRKFAWGPIISGIKSREESITNSLAEAEKARDEMSNLKAENEKLLQEARKEREAMLKEAAQTRDSIVTKAREEAAAAAAKEMEKAKTQIDAEKNAALAELKQQAGFLAVEMAEKILRKELGSATEKAALASKLVAELSKN